MCALSGISPIFKQDKKSNNIKCVTVQLCSFFNKKVLLCLLRAYPFNAIRAISPKVMSLYRKCNGFNGFERCFKTQQACATNNPQMQNFSLGFWCCVTCRLGCIGTNKPLPCHKPRFVFLVFCHWSVWFAFASPFVLRLLRFCFPVGCLFGVTNSSNLKTFSGVCVQTRFKFYLARSPQVRVGGGCNIFHLGTREIGISYSGL